MTIAGSEMLTRIMHAISESLLIPVIVGLIILLIIALMELGGFIAEKRKRKNFKKFNLVEIIHDVGDIYTWKIKNFRQVIEESPLNGRQKKLVNDYLDKNSLNKDLKEIVARNILDKEEISYKQQTNKTDLLAKVGPILGLMGTLIPLGPGLGALGQGDFQGLAESIMVAFDTTVIGMTIGGIGAFISKIRSHWYSEELYILETILDLIIGGGEGGYQKNEASAVIRG